MIKRQTVTSLKRASKKMDFHPDQRTVQMLCDALLEALDKLDGGQDHIDWTQERRTKDAQVKLAVEYVDACLARGDLQRARYAMECAKDMLAAKLAWRHDWSWYVPSIDEEFGELVI